VNAAVRPDERAVDLGLDELAIATLRTDGIVG
jgi:hypothetical protein